MENKLTTSKKEAGISLLLSVFFIIFMWGFFTRDFSALGVNLSIYLGALVTFFVMKLRKKGKYEKSDLAWIVPLFLIALSYSLYENPFIKACTVLVFPLVSFLFYAYSWVEKKEEIDWDANFILKIAKHILSFFVFLISSVKLLMNTIYDKEKAEVGMTKRVVIGVALLLLSLLIIVPLLSSADPVFAEKLRPFYDAIINILSTSIVAKIIVMTVLSIGTLASYLAWGRSHTIENDNRVVKRDIVITSIVLGGIFVVYLLFLWIQFDRLWVGALPFDFKETENLVKSGFWQLLFLSLVNLAIFFFLYRKTENRGQKLLGMFSIASILLLTSSAYRMWLYVTHYGFSYEKFYAAYVVVFCMVLFLWLISRLFTNKKSNVVKFLAFQFLWMYALVTILPVEYIILNSNMRLVEKTDSKIVLREMTMLSGDVLRDVKKYVSLGKLKDAEWSEWIERQEKRIGEKKWYESTLSSSRNN